MGKADPRIFLTGTGGQGTLTATRLLAQAALDAGIEVVAGEVHGMAQRGGVVESAILLGGWRALRLDLGEADILLGFEELETLRALPYLKQGGIVFSSEDRLPPLSVCLGQAEYPEREIVVSALSQKAADWYFIPCREIGKKAGNARAASTALLGALCESGLLPFGIPALEAAINSNLPERIREANIEAMLLGAEIIRNRQGQGKENG